MLTASTSQSRKHQNPDNFIATVPTDGPQKRRKVYPSGQSRVNDMDIGPLHWLVLAWYSLHPVLFLLFVVDLPATQPTSFAFYLSDEQKIFILRFMLDNILNQPFTRTYWCSDYLLPRAFLQFLKWLANGMARANRCPQVDLQPSQSQKRRSPHRPHARSFAPITR